MIAVFILITALTIFGAIVESGHHAAPNEPKSKTLALVYFGGIGVALVLGALITLL